MNLAEAPVLELIPQESELAKKSPRACRCPRPLSSTPEAHYLEGVLFQATTVPVRKLGSEGAASLVKRLRRIS